MQVKIWKNKSKKNLENGCSQNATKVEWFWIVQCQMQSLWLQRLVFLFCCIDFFILKFFSLHGLFVFGILDTKSL
jgi:hypothetical protein